jgi:hypothetical protein
LRRSGNETADRIDGEDDVSRADRRNDSVQSKEESARHALHGYRERRRRRRGEDTYFGSLDVLGDAVHAGVSEDELDRRRSAIMAEAKADGMPHDLAELLYDVAYEEGLDPALAFELVRTGLGVAPPPEGLASASEEPMVDKYLPAWMFPATPTDNLLRERMLRVSFRRLRSFLEANDDVDDAFRRFAAEPDVGHYGF